MCPKIREIIISSNKIRVVKNLSKLNELQLLDISDNLIEDQSALKPLHQNVQLRYLNVRGNPVALRTKHRKEMLEYLPQLTMIDADIQVRFIIVYFPPCSLILLFINRKFQNTLDMESLA